MENRFYAHQYSYEELCQMTEIEIKRLRCNSPEDIKALEQVMQNGKKLDIVLPEPKPEPEEIKPEINENELKTTLIKIKEATLDNKLKVKISLLEDNFDPKKAQKIIKETIG